MRARALIDHHSYTRWPVCSLWPTAANGGSFNWSLQHTNHRIGDSSVANEAATQNLLFGNLAIKKLLYFKY